MGVKLVLQKNNNHLEDNGYSKREEDEIFEEQLRDLYDNPRWYLDNFEFLQEYRVSWKDYKTGYQITMPYKFCRQSS